MKPDEHTAISGLELGKKGSNCRCDMSVSGCDRCTIKVGQNASTSLTLDVVLGYS